MTTHDTCSGTAARRAATGRGWQDDGPVLRNSSQRQADLHHWGVVEAIVWIATRDLASVQGALFWVEHGDYINRPVDQANDRGINAKIVLETLLIQDVAGHAEACPVRQDAPPCDCAGLQRIRFCRCSNRQESWEITCSCVLNSKAEFIAAIHDGLPLYGKRDGEPEHVKVPQPALAGLGLIYDEHGAGLLHSFSRVLVSVSEIRKRWPAGFEDRPIRVSNSVPGEVEAGRGDSYLKVAALTRFIQRAKAHQTKWPKIAEVDIIVLDGTCGSRQSVTKWIRKHHATLYANGHFKIGAVPAVVEAIEQELESDRQRRVSADEKRRKKAG